ncbi:hypothetical protein [Paractinoplanes brasiliensis]|nr:hypothetical protein [Actinoplanes brasiliensis]GID30703.1 hypothetical protein Abr02nite_56860 [Actinoplanes brasiliensis]
MTEDDRAVRILRTMADEPLAPSTVDVARTMHEGRRRRRARHWSGGVAVVAVTAVAAGGGTMAVAAMQDAPQPPVVTPTTVAAAPTPVPKNCRVTLLPSRGISKALVTAGDPTGRYLAGRVYPPGGVETVLWKDGKLLPAPPMPGADASWDDINSSGLAVGYSNDAKGRQSAYSSRAGGTRLAGGRAVAVAINDAGVIAGTLAEPHFGGKPARWASDKASPEELPLPAGYIGGDATEIDEDGTIAGRIYRKAGEGHGYLWLPDGTGRLLSPPTVDGKKAAFFWPESIIEGVVYGRTVGDLKDGTVRPSAPFRYTIATGAFERLPGGDLGTPVLGAANGWALGTKGINDAVIAVGDKVVPLPRYQGMREYVVSAFSADGKVAGGYTTDMSDEDVANRPLVWNCEA